MVKYFFHRTHLNCKKKRKRKNHLWATLEDIKADLSRGGKLNDMAHFFPFVFSFYSMLYSMSKVDP